MYESLGDVYERQGRSQETIEQWRRAAELSADSELAAILNATDAKCGFASAVRAIAAKNLERLASRTKSEYVPAINFARAYLRMGDKEQALRWLKTACEERNVHSLTIGSDRLYDSLRTDLRFVKLLQRMKLGV